MKKLITKFTYILLVLMLSAGIAFAASQQTSSTDASDVITYARYYLNEPTAIFWSDAELLAYLNMGTMDIVARTHCLEAIEIEVLVANQLSYALSDAYILVKAVVYAQAAGDEKGLIRGNIQSLGHMEEVGEPVYWDQEQDNIIVWPKPDATHSGAGHDIDVYTVKRPVKTANYALTDLTFVDGGVGVDTITTAAGDFVAAGFETDGIFTVSGSTSNDGSYTIVSVVAATITLATGTLTAEGAADVTASLISVIPVPACYDRALTLYVAAQAFYKDGKFAKAGRFMAEYLAELNRYRMDFVTVPKEPIDIIK